MSASLRESRILSMDSQCSGRVMLHMPHRLLCSRAGRQLQARSRAKVTVSERPHVLWQCAKTARRVSMMVISELCHHCHVLLYSSAVRQCHVSRLCKQLLECSGAARSKAYDSYAHRVFYLHWFGFTTRRLSCCLSNFPHSKSSTTRCSVPDKS